MPAVCDVRCFAGRSGHRCASWHTHGYGLTCAQVQIHAGTRCTRDRVASALAGSSHLGTAWFSFPPPPFGIGVPALPSTTYPFVPHKPHVLLFWSSPTDPRVHDHSESKGAPAGSFYFSHKLPQRPGWRERWAISFGTGGGENTGRKKINKSAFLSLSSAPPPHDLTPLHPLCFVLHRWPRGTGKLILRWSFSPSGPPLSTQSCSGADVALRSTSDCRAGAGGEGGMGGPNAEEAPSPPVEQATGACFPSLGLAFPGRNMQTDGGSGPRMSANQKGAPLPVRAWRWAEEVPVLDIWNHQNGV